MVKFGRYQLRINLIFPYRVWRQLAFRLNDSLEKWQMK